MYPQILYEFWAGIPDARKRELGVEIEKKETAHQMFHRYYNTRLHQLWEHCCKQKGTKTYDWKVMFDHWRTVYPASEKKDKDLAFESDTNASRMIEGWMALMLKEEKERRDAMQAEYEKKMAEVAAKEEKRKKKMEEKLKASRNVEDVPNTDTIGKPMTDKKKKKLQQQSNMRNLATPKDRLLRGKTVVQLQTKFPDDKILRQMLISEFANDKIVKRPLEYDYVDSEEEDRMKMRDFAKAKGKRSKSQDGERGAKGDSNYQEEKEKKRAKELLDRFAELSKKYNTTKKVEIQKDIEYESKYQKQTVEFEKFMNKNAVKYRRNMLAKANIEVPSENQFLSDVNDKSYRYTSKLTVYIQS